MTNRKFWQAAILIAILAFGVRALVIWSTSPMQMAGDEPEYVESGKALLKEKRFVSATYMQTLFQGGHVGEPTAFRSPVFPVFLAAHYAVFRRE